MIRQTNRESSGVKDKLESRMTNYVAACAKLRELASKYEKSEGMPKLLKALGKMLFSITLTTATGGITVVALLAPGKIKELLDGDGVGDWQEIAPKVIEILTDFIT